MVVGGGRRVGGPGVPERGIWRSSLRLDWAS